MVDTICYSSLLQFYLKIFDFMRDSVPDPPYVWNFACKSLTLSFFCTSGAAFLAVGSFNGCAVLFSGGVQCWGQYSSVSIGPNPVKYFQSGTRRGFALHFISDFHLMFFFS